MFTVAKILEMLPSEGGVEQKTLEKMLKLTKKVDRTRLEIAVKALNKLEIIERNSQNILKKSANENSIRASIRCSSKGYCFAVREDEEEDIYIRENFLNHAWHGDKVLVRINREGIRRRSPEGQVLCVLQRAKANLLASIEKSGDNFLAKPLDERILSKIEIPLNDTKILKTSEENNIVHIKVNKYPIAQKPAKGEVVRKLSLNDGPEGDLEIIKTKYNLIEDNSPPNVSIKKPLTKQRVNLEKQPSIIFQTWSTDQSPIVPCFFAEPNEGGIKLFIHVPTVCERINFGSKLDEWIRNRSKSICFGDTWKNLLSNKLIAESAFQVDKPSSSITLELDMNKNGDITNWEFYLSSIKPISLINREHLDTLHKRKKGSRTIPAKLKSIKTSISNLETILFISELINKRLTESGLIQLDQDIPDINNLYDLSITPPGLDLDGWMPSFSCTKPESIINLLTKYSNIILTLHFKSLDIESINLTKPLQENFQVNDIIKSALLLDTKITVNEEGLLSFNDLVSAIKASPHKHLIQKLAKNYITDYRFSNSSINEYPITDFLDLKKLPLYNETPWTNPGTNYSDIINQFILCKLLSEGKTPKLNKDKIPNFLGKRYTKLTVDWSIFTNTQKSLITKMCSEGQIADLNTKRNQAKSFRDGLLSFIQLRSVEQNINQTIEGTITGVQSYGFFVEIEPSFAEGLVHVSSLDDDWYEYRSRQNLLVGRKNKKTYQIGDKVSISILKVDLLRNQIDLDIDNKEKQSNSDSLIVNDGELKGNS